MSALLPRRSLLIAGSAALWLRPAFATPETMAAAIAAFTGGAPVRDGRVLLDIAPLVENGNTVPVTVSVPGVDQASDPVRRLALFTERNPQPEVAVFTLGPLAGRAQASTRMRLATSQTVVAMAQLADGSHWQQRVQVVVTLAACVEGG
jgi:sulfur-oxidizing protein SoxY